MHSSLLMFGLAIQGSNEVFQLPPQCLAKYAMVSFKTKLDKTGTLAKSYSLIL